MARKRKSRSRTTGPSTGVTSTTTGTTTSGTGSRGRKATKAKTPGRGTWRLMDRASSMVAGLVAQRASVLAWRTVTGKKPPVNGQHPEVGGREAVAWAVVGGALVELVKVAASRGAASYWVKSTGRLPPGMKPLQPTPPGTTKEPVLTEPAPRKRKVSRRSRGR